MKYLDRSDWGRVTKHLLHIRSWTTYENSRKKSDLCCTDCHKKNHTNSKNQKNIGRLGSKVRSSLCVLPLVSQYWPDTCCSLDLRQVDSHLAALRLMCDGFGVDQVRGSANGHLLLQTSSNVASACQHKRVFCIRLKLCDQLPLQISLYFHALLVVQDLWTHTEIHKKMYKGASKMHKSSPLALSNSKKKAMWSLQRCPSNLTPHHIC